VGERERKHPIPIKHIMVQAKVVWYKKQWWWYDNENFILCPCYASYEILKKNTLVSTLRTYFVCFHFIRILGVSQLLWLLLPFQAKIMNQTKQNIKPLFLPVSIKFWYPLTTIIITPFTTPFTIFYYSIHTHHYPLLSKNTPIFLLYLPFQR
jgi:hypothetical protein